MTPIPPLPVGVIGATSFTGERIVACLREAGVPVVAFTRQALSSPGGQTGVRWCRLPSASGPCAEAGQLSALICAAPAVTLAAWLPMISATGAKRVVMLSSTSLFTKADSHDPEEIALAGRLTEAERSLRDWAQTGQREWVVLRPTLIYGRGRDKNVAELARLIRRLRFFPLFGAARGLRQPVHVDDVAAAAVSAARRRGIAGHSYEISGGETLAYREMLARIFRAAGLRPRFLPVPLWSFRVAVSLLRRLPRYRHWNTAMAERMNRDMAFDHAAAARDLGFAPRAFHLLPEDVQT